MATIEIRKLRLIDKLLKLKNDKLLEKIENILKKNSTESSKKNSSKSIYDFEGFLPIDDVEKMKNTISETCEKIDDNVWEK